MKTLQRLQNGCDTLEAFFAEPSRRIESFLLRVIKTLTRIKFSFIGVWLLGFALVYYFQTKQPGQGAAIVASNQLFDLPLEILWANEDEIGIAAGDAAAEEPRIMVLPLAFKSEEASVFQHGVSSVSVDAKPLTLSKSEAHLSAAAVEPRGDGMAAVYPSGTGYVLAVWERKNPEAKTVKTLPNVPRYHLTQDGIRIPVTIDDMAWLKVPAIKGPDTACVVVFYSSKPGQTKNHGADLAASLRKGNKEENVVEAGAVWVAVRNREAATGFDKDDKAIPNGPVLGNAVYQKNLSALLGPFNGGVSHYGWSGAGQTNPANPAQRLVHVHLGTWTKTQRKQRPYIFSLAGLSEARLIPLNLGDGGAVDLDPGEVSWSGDGQKLLFAAKTRPCDIKGKNDWDGLRQEKHQSDWETDLFQKDVKDAVSSANDTRFLLPIQGDGSRYPVGVTLTNTESPTTSPPQSCALFTTTMNSQRHNIWLYRLSNDLSNGTPNTTLPGNFTDSFVELTYLRRIVRRPRVFHSGEYLYVATVDSEEVRNGASPFRYRVVVFRWKEKELYDRLDTP